MKNLVPISILAAALIGAATGCEFKKNISRDEIPIIKKSVGEIETAIRADDAAGLDSLLSNEAARSGTSARSILDFVYHSGPNDTLAEFVGFTDKQIFFRGDAARVDASISGPGGPVADVTITLKKEHDIWRIKKIGPRIDEPLKEGDSAAKEGK
jgi:hypothetical protein